MSRPTHVDNRDDLDVLRDYADKLGVCEYMDQYGDPDRARDRMGLTQEYMVENVTKRGRAFRSDESCPVITKKLNGDTPPEGRANVVQQLYGFNPKIQNDDVNRRLITAHLNAAQWTAHQRLSLAQIKFGEPQVAEVDGERAVVDVPMEIGIDMDVRHSNGSDDDAPLGRAEVTARYEVRHPEAERSGMDEMLRPNPQSVTVHGIGRQGERIPLEKESKTHKPDGHDAVAREVSAGPEARQIRRVAEETAQAAFDNLEPDSPSMSM